MLLIIAAIIIIVTPIVFCKKIDELSITQMSGALAPQYWGTGSRYLVGDFITEDDFENIRTKVNSKNSKF
ncbi:MAG: hypothetical protein IJE68_02600 [Clostridia bacterium]|nr:hypothetical protein [Clostridia bacterium]